MEELKEESIKSKNATQIPNISAINEQKKEGTNQNIETNNKDK